LTLDEEDWSLTLEEDSSSMLLDDSSELGSTKLPLSSSPHAAKKNAKTNATMDPISRQRLLPG
jgi:hypothetical protein